MASAGGTLVIQNQFSAVFTQYINLSIQVANASNQAAQAAKNLSAGNQQAAKSLGSLGSGLKKLLSSYVSLQNLKSLLGFSDTLAQTQIRLDAMNDGLQTTAQLSDMIFASAQRSRGAYQDTANAVSQLGMLAGSAFESSQEIVAFAEQMNKQMALSGASASDAQAAIQQITESMAKGSVEGEALSAILRRAPSIADALAGYMGVGADSLQEMASEGKITADVMKNALFAAADETNQRFAAMPATWSQVWTMVQNVVQNAAQPISDVISAIVNNAEKGVQWVQDHLPLIEAALAGVAAAAAIAGIQMMGSALSSAGAWMVANIWILAVVAAVALMVFAARQAGATWQEIGGFIGGVFGAMYAAAMNNFIVPAQQILAAFVNFLGNVFKNPVASIKILFVDMAIFIISRIRAVANGIESLLNAIPGVEVNLTGGLDNIYNRLQDARDTIKDESGWKEYIKPWADVDYTDAWNTGSAIGAGIGDKLDHFSLSDLVGKFAPETGAGAYSAQPYSPQLDGISQSVAGIEKSVDMTQEDLESLIDMAERRYVNQINLTSQTPIINVSGQNTGRTQADRTALAEAMKRVLVEQISSSSVRSTARAF